MASSANLDTFSVRRSDTLELSLPNYMRSRNNNISRSDFCKAVFESLGQAAKTAIKCVQRSTSGTNFRVTFKRVKMLSEINYLSRASISTAILVIFWNLVPYAQNGHLVPVMFIAIVVSFRISKMDIWKPLLKSKQKMLCLLPKKLL